MPTVSIIIPTWEHAPELGETLEAIRKQTFQDFEVIVVDDASTDNILQVVKEEQKKSSFQFYQLPQHSLAPRARNEGFDHSTGKYLLFLDADAVMAPDTLELLVEALDQNPQASFAYASFVFGRTLFNGKPFSAEALRERNFIHTSSLIRREAFPRFDEKLTKFQDWDLWLTVSERGGTGVFVDRTLFQIKERKKNWISKWLPSFMYKLPWPIFGWMPEAIRRYREGEKIIRAKHQL